MNYKIGKIKNNVALPSKFDMMFDSNIMFYVTFIDDTGTEGPVSSTYAEVAVHALIVDISSDMGNIRYDLVFHHDGKGDVVIGVITFMWIGQNDDIRRKVTGSKVSS